MVSILRRKPSERASLLPEAIAAQNAELAARAQIMSRPAAVAGYANDPRTGIANSLINTGSDTSPLAGGMTEGIARALSGLAGGYIGGQQRNKWAAKDAQLNTARNAALGPQIDEAMGGSQPAPGASQVANALVQPPQPQQGASVAPPIAPRPTPPGLAPASNLSTPTGPLTAATTPSVTSPGTGANRLTPRELVPGEPAGVDRRAAWAAQQQQPEAAAANYDTSPYSTVLGYGQYGRPPKPLETMSIGEAAAFGRNVLIPATKGRGIGVDSRGDLGSSAMGAYQITQSTLRGAARQVYGENWRQVPFNAETQDRLGGKLFEGSKGSNASMRNQWASLKGMKDSDLEQLRAMPWDQAKTIIQQKEGTAGGMSRANTSASGGGGTGTGDVPAPQPVPVPDLPPPPEPVKAPEFGDRVRSVRLGIVKNLLGDSGLDASSKGALIDEFLGEGLNDEQKSREQREADIVHRTEMGYQSDLGVNAHQRQGLFDQEIAAHNAAVAQNYSLQGKEAEHKYTLKENEEKDRAALERQEAKGAPGRKPPVGQINSYLTRRNSARVLNEIITGISAIPDSTGLGYDKIPESVLQRYDPKGVETRAAIAEYTGQLLHDLSGATVAPEEAARLLPFMPRITDAPAELKKKANRLLLEISNMNSDTRKLFTNADGTSFFDPLETGGSAVPTPAAASSPDAGWSVKEK